MDANDTDNPERGDKAEQRKPETPWRDAWHDVAPHLDLGWRLVGAAGGPPALGWGVDLALNTTPVFVMVGSLLAVISVGYIVKELYHEGEPPKK